MIPVPGGTSTHLVGAGLLAMLHGPLVAFVCESLVLLLQALFFGAGGITVLGVNALAMGLLGPLVAWAVYASLRQWAPKLGAFAGAYLGMQVSTVLLALALGLQHRLSTRAVPHAVPRDARGDDAAEPYRGRRGGGPLLRVRPGRPAARSW